MNGEDEQHCSLLETNLCKQGYFRCRNGLCIPESLLYDLTNSIDCLDMSDAFNGYYTSSEDCYDNPIIFFCDENICTLSRFACGDGSCVETSLFQDESHCRNGRNLIFTRSMLYNQNSYLPDECWKTIICSFKLQYIFNINCSELCVSNYYNIVIKQTCPSEFFFPPNPILFNSIRLIYNTTTKTKWINDVTPTYICYDTQQCKSLVRSNTIRINGTMCQKYEEFGLNNEYERLDDLLNDMTNLFKACSLPGLEIVTNSSAIIDYNDDHECSHPSLIHCKGSSRCVSKYRIIDGHEDCFNSYDEYYNQSCLLNLTHREQCEYTSNCIPITLQSIVCPTGFIGSDLFSMCEFITWYYVCKYLLRPVYGLPFGKLCDKLIELKPDNKNETDETNCQSDWPCFTKYTTCDNYWHCKNGVDEVNCSRGSYHTYPMPYDCGSNEHFCQRPNTSDITCIHIEDIKNNEIQCLGATDHRDFCQQKYPKEIQRRYRCLNSSECINVLELCDCKEDCPLGDDEYIVCPWLRNFTCDPNVYQCKNGDILRLNSRCDGISGCTDLNEDEMYCYLIDFFLSTKSVGWFSTDGFSTFPTQILSISSSTDLSNASDNFDYPSQSNSIDSAFVYWHCNRGILIYFANTFGCLCPPAYYGTRCQYQSDRISIMVLIRKQTAFETNIAFKLVFFLLDNETNIIATEQIIYMQSETCEPRYNIYLLYDHQPKMFTNYSVRVDAYSQNIFNKLTEYRASWHYSIPFNFLPVFKLVIDPMIPETKVENNNASRICAHGQWLPYVNSDDYFCLCEAGWSGKSCNVSYKCQCAKNSLCIGHTAFTKRLICLCELEKFGPLCFIPNTVCQSNSCLNNSKCVSLDERETGSYHCVCTPEYYGNRCQYRSFRILLKFIDVEVSPSILIHLVTATTRMRIKYEVIFQRIRLDVENDITIYVQKPFGANIGYAELNENYYLIFLLSGDFIRHESISSYISLSNRCPHVRELFNQTILDFHLLRRAKYYHRPCLEQHQLICFHDEVHMCLCNEKHQTDCYGFPHNRTYNCDGHNYCENNALCFHDELRCPTYSKCVCRECFYGVRCQFTTSVYILTLDSIIGPYITPEIAFDKQSLIIKLSLAATAIIFVIGLTDNILSMITFSQENILSTGCGVYLLSSSITSTLTIIVFSYKFICFLCTQILLTSNSTFLYINCIITEFCLKFLPAMNSWFNACVAIERVTCVILGIKFNREKGRRIAVIISLLVVLFNIASAIHDPFSRQLFDNDERIWCAATYHRTPQSDLYNKITIIIHLIVPFVVNFVSATVIIIKSTRIRSRATIEYRSYRGHLRTQFEKHKHLIISPSILIVLALPRSILSFFSGCMRSERESSIFLSLYFLSFLPSMTTFIVFVLPSQTYLQEFYCVLKRYRTNIELRLHMRN